ncbi:MAG: hypothetical protein HN509_17080 [Halobacteriovoraceae bacterium]|jgi:hypothetical protein|nr:hypothetical protein [Halobacteriovoraceae bacterium]MBT5094434.1 hypothetical protein [Halobacteriovoraceae bacterium]
MRTKGPLLSLGLLLGLFSGPVNGAEKMSIATCYQSPGEYHKNSTQGPVFLINPDSSSEHTYVIKNLAEIAPLRSIQKAKVILQFEVLKSCHFQCNIKVKSVVRRLMPWDTLKAISKISQCP